MNQCNEDVCFCVVPETGEKVSHDDRMFYLPFLGCEKCFDLFLTDTFIKFCQQKYLVILNNHSILNYIFGITSSVNHSECGLTILRTRQYLIR